MAKSTPPPPPARSAGFCMIRSGELAGRSFLLDRSTLTVGCGPESDIVIYDTSLARVHLQFARQADGDYVRALTNQHNSQLNGLPLKAPRLLFAGDVITLGNIQLAYALAPEAQTTPIPPVSSPLSEAPLNLPFSLRLPSKQQKT